jgi:hypothetical protein
LSTLVLEVLVKLSFLLGLLAVGGRLNKNGSKARSVPLCSGVPIRGYVEPLDPVDTLRSEVEAELESEVDESEIFLFLGAEEVLDG